MAAPTVVMQAPPSFGGKVHGTPSGTQYTVNALGQVIAQYADVAVLTRLGFTPVISPGQSGIVGTLLGANMNSTADQPFALQVNASAILRPFKVLVANASIPLTAAQGGIYTLPNKAQGQGLVVAANQAYTGLTGPGVALELTIANQLKLTAGTSLFLSLTTAQGAAATADFYLFGDQLPR